MSEARKKADWPIVVALVLAVVVAATGLYMIGYLTTSKLRVDGKPGTYRSFAYQRQAEFFAPAARVESYIRGVEIDVAFGE